MKKILSYLLLLLPLTWQSCLFQEDEVFDDSAANRLSAEVIKCQELLKAAPNGWKLEYFIGSNYTGGGIVFLMRFDGKNVEMTAEIGPAGFKPGNIVSSLYQVQSEQSTMITFDSYNPLLHAYSAPLDANINIGGDYEFIVMSASEDKIVLQGKRYKNIMEMTPVPKDIPWRIFLDDILTIQKQAPAYTYLLKKGDQVLKQFIRSESSLSTFAAYNENVSDDPDILPFIFTEKGLKLHSPYEINGMEIQYFKWNKKTKVFTCTDDNASDVQLTEFTPQNLTPYEAYLGQYTAVFQQMNDPNVHQKTVLIEQKEAGKSYVLKGLEMVDIPLTYSKVNGALKMDSEALGSTGSYYLASAAGFIGYPNAELTLPATLRSGMVGAIVKTSPLSLTFVDKVNLSNPNLIIWAYSSEDYTEANLMGYFSWYSALSLVKK